MKRTVKELESILAVGGGLFVCAAGKTQTDLHNLAKAAAKNTTKLVLTNCHACTVAELKTIAKHGNGYVFFENVE